jgi:hypothetical protein
MRHKPNFRLKSLLSFGLALLPLSQAYAIVYQGPLVVNDAWVKLNGNIVTGNYQGTASAPAITISTAAPITIVNSNVTGPGDLIYGSNVNLTVIDTTGIATNPNVSGLQKGMFVHVQSAVSLLVENNNVTGTRFGVYVNVYAGNFTHTQTIKIMNNVINNIDARPSNGNGGYVTTGEYNGHAFQLNGVHSVPDMEIGWNQVINVPGQSQCSDIINIYQSSGTAASHLLIHDNYLQGAFPANPGTANKYTGGGIITDGSAKDTVATATAFVDVYRNQVVSSANYGIAIAAGHDNNYFTNTVVSSGYLPGNVFMPMSFGNGVNNFNNYQQPATVFYNNIMQNNNPIGFIASTSTGAPRRSDYFLPGQTGNTNISFIPNDSTNPTMTDEANQLSLWRQKLKTNKVILGLK